MTFCWKNKNRKININTTFFFPQGEENTETFSSMLQLFPGDRELCLTLKVGTYWEIQSLNLVKSKAIIIVRKLEEIAKKKSEVFLKCWVQPELAVPIPLSL